MLSINALDRLNVEASWLIIVIPSFIVVFLLLSCCTPRPTTSRLGGQRDQERWQPTDERRSLLEAVRGQRSNGVDRLYARDIEAYGVGNAHVGGLEDVRAYPTDRVRLMKYEVLRERARQITKSRQTAWRKYTAIRAAGHAEAAIWWKKKTEEYMTEAAAANKLAAEEAFKHFNPHYDAEDRSSLESCDLHGLMREEAKVSVERIRQACMRLGIKTQFIIRKSKSSPDRFPKLLSIMTELLEEQHVAYQIGVPNDGCITVYWSTDSGKALSSIREDDVGL